MDVRIYNNKFITKNKVKYNQNDYNKALNFLMQMDGDDGESSNYDWMSWEKDFEDPTTWEIATWSNDEEKRLIGFTIARKLYGGKIDLSGCTELKDFFCEVSGVEEINLSRCTNLESFCCEYNHRLTSLNLSECTKLNWFFCVGSPITKLDITNCTSLNNINFSEIFYKEKPKVPEDIKEALSIWSSVTASIFSAETSKRIRLSSISSGYLGDNYYYIICNNNFEMSMLKNKEVIDKLTKSLEERTGKLFVLKPILKKDFTYKYKSIYGEQYVSNSEDSNLINDLRIEGVNIICEGND